MMAVALLVAGAAGATAVLWAAGWGPVGPQGGFPGGAAHRARLEALLAAPGGRSGAIPAGGRARRRLLELLEGEAARYADHWEGPPAGDWVGAPAEPWPSRPADQLAGEPWERPRCYGSGSFVPGRFPGEAAACDVCGCFVGVDRPAGRARGGTLADHAPASRTAA